MSGLSTAGLIRLGSNIHSLLTNKKIGALFISPKSIIHEILGVKKSISSKAAPAHIAYENTKAKAESSNEFYYNFGNISLFSANKL